MKISTTFLKKTTAFSLVELLVVITIISIVLAFTIPSLSLIGSNRLNSSGNEFTNVLKHARNRAVTEGGPYLVAINDDKRYSIFTFKRYETNTIVNGVLRIAGDFVNDPVDGSRTWVQKWRYIQLKEGIEWANVETMAQITNRPIFGAELPTNTVNYVIFEPDGSITSKPKRFQLKQHNNTNNTYDVVVVKETGSVKVERK